MGDDTICHNNNESITMRSIPNFEISFVYRFVYFLSANAAHSTARRRGRRRWHFCCCFCRLGEGKSRPNYRY